MRGESEFLKELISKFDLFSVGDWIEVSYWGVKRLGLNGVGLPIREGKESE